MNLVKVSKSWKSIKYQVFFQLTTKIIKYECSTYGLRPIHPRRNPKPVHTQILRLTCLGIARHSESSVRTVILPRNFSCRHISLVYLICTPLHMQRRIKRWGMNGTGCGGEVSLSQELSPATSYACPPLDVSFPFPLTSVPHLPSQTSTLPSPSPSPSRTYLT
jgi:hypothetical protein